MQAAAAEGLAGGGVEKHRIGRKQRHAVSALGGHGHQRRRAGGNSQRVNADDAQCPPLGRVAVGIQRIAGDFKHRAGRRHLRAVGNACIKVFVKTALHSAQFQIGLAIDSAHRLRKFAQRRRVNQMHRKGQRHAQHDCHDGSGIAPGVVTKFLPGKSAKQSEHDAIVPRCRREPRMSPASLCGKIAGMNSIQIEQIERATLAAVSPAAVEALPGWLLGLDPGTVGRAHSAVPLQHGAPDATLLGNIEARYAARGLVPVFRLPQVASFELLCAALTQRRYVAAQPTQVQTSTASAMALGVGGAGGADVTLAPAPDEAWAAVFQGDGFDPADAVSRVQLLSRAKDAVFASVRVNGIVVAAGVGSFSHGWASVHGMRTAQSHRGQGLARSILGALARAALARTIEQVFLQVDAGNAGAQALYRRAGFTTAWTYGYWRKLRANPDG